MKRLFTVMALIFALTLSFIATTAEASTAYFSDVPSNHWAHQYIQYASQNGLVNGYGNGTFGPNGTLTEAQCCQIVYNVLGNQYQNNYGNQYQYNYGNQYQYNQGYSQQYPQYNQNYGQSWYSQAVQFVEANSSLRIVPERNASRALVCEMVYCFAGSPTGNYSYCFTDCGSLSNNTQVAIAYCQTTGIINGYQDYSFRPHNALTRAEGAKIFSLAHQRAWRGGFKPIQIERFEPKEAVQYAEELGLTAEVESQNYLSLYVENNRKYVFTYGNNQYTGFGRVYSPEEMKAYIAGLANRFSTKEKAQIACQVTGTYAKSLGWRIIDLGEWPSYDNTRGLYWHRLRIVNSRQDFEFLCGGNIDAKEAYWYLIDSTNGFRAMNGRTEVLDLINRYS